LRGPDSLYVVRTSIMPFQWVRNKLPTFELTLFPPQKRRVGCESDLPLSIQYKAADIDGNCDSVVFFTRDTNASLGNVHFERSCTDHNVISLPLRAPFNSISDSIANTLDNSLFIEVWDDNYEVRRDTIQFQSSSNIKSVAGGGRVNAQPAYFRNTEVPIWIEGSDVDGPVYGFKIDWGDGSLPTSPPLKNDNSHYLRDSVTHIYRDTGNFTITNTVFEECRPESTSFVFPKRDIIRIRDDNKPQITLDMVGYLLEDTLSYKINLTVIDADADIGIDSLEIVIDWGDGNLETINTKMGKSYENQSLTHRYLAKPRDGAFYKLHVKATDSQKGSDLVSRLIPPYAP
jgi:hypothetical protein